jgi:hypothetical protein
MNKIIYYNFFKIIGKIKTNDNPAFSAFLLICLLQQINLLTITAPLYFFYELHISKNTGVYFSSLLFFLISAINYFLILKKKHDIVKEYEQMTIKKQLHGRIYSWLYVLISVLAFYFVLNFFVRPQY